jgi:hypothetical protein
MEASAGDDFPGDYHGARLVRLTEGAMTKPVLALIVTAIMLCGCNQPAEQLADSSAPQSAAEPAHQAAIDPNVFDPMTRDSYPKAFAKWGVKGIERVNALRIAAAQTAAKIPSCDRVEISELSDARSTPPDNPAVFVDCTNGQRFYLTETDVGGAVASETERGARFTKSEVVGLCENALKAQLTIPLSLDRDLLNTSAFQAETTGRWRVDLTFKAQNALGAKLPGRAACTLGTDGTPEVSILE